ncbi:Myb/SANT-like domain [Macleaya cordata]|uniref:Myb/SANT-like domain n=1 Tax=Macleaya cordata TaxID=56857 RepID=A0A200RCN3_MACCD|nr:Myb/SANT-like domain [Macleaya cordata]
MESLSQEANHDAGEGNKGTSHLRWTTEMDRVLIDTFMKELTLGNKGDNGWKPCAYAQVRKNMRKRLGVTLMSHHIRNRLKTWKCHCVAINKCLEHSEFRWDEVSMTLTAPDSVWASYLKENPKADGYRMKCIPNFKDICRITGHEQIIDTFTRTGPENVAGEKGEEGDDNKGTTHLRWNTVMDQVLVDTLLKQLELGNKGDNGWKPCAYSQVKRNMRKKLGIIVTGDHIRNRLKTWKVHYVTIKKCLEHSGFQWDQASKMLTAPDSVWSAYLQKNPKAAVYRMKCIPNFKDISRVMGNGQVIDALTRTSPENVAGEKDEGSQIGEANSDGGEDNKGTSQLRWNTAMDKVLVDTLLKQLELGNKGDTGWKPIAYAQVRRSLRKTLGITIMSDHVRNRLKTWKAQCTTVSKCLEHGGFRWDALSQMLTAPDPVWTAYLKKNSKAAGYRMKCIPNFKDICRVMGHEKIIDALTRTGPESLAGEKDEGSQIGGGIEDLAIEQDLGDLGTQNEKHTQPTSSSSVPTRQEVPLKRKKEQLKRKRESHSEVGMVDILGSLAEGIQRIASAMEDKKPVDLGTLVQELSKIPDFSDELVIQASEFLAYDDRWARLFFALSVDQRKSWLLKRLGHQMV